MIRQPITNVRITRSTILPLLVSMTLVSVASADIANTLHNLTPTGSGIVKNPDPVGLCRFCHTPHRALQTTALWNRELPTSAYDIYESSTLNAVVGQPTGSSRLCLSCHDGTVAIGSVLHAPGETIAPLPPLEGRTLIGTDLMDDHPISFLYDEGLALQNGELVPPTALAGNVQLDSAGRVQCTSCHDPHSDRVQKFLVEPIQDGTLCVACHVKNGWSESSHAISAATWNGQGDDPWPGSQFGTVGENACLSCHTPHAAPHPERLLVRDPEENVCLVCHNGNVARTDVRAQLLKANHHPVEETSGIHDPLEDPLSMSRHVSCADCHNPHAVNSTSASPPLVTGAQQHVRGVDLGGSPVAEAQFAYEICFKCHGLAEALSPRVIRHDNVTNVRLEVHSSNLSYHPVTAIGTNPGAITLLPPLTPSSQIFCHDCHNTDDKQSPGPDTAVGPHGSFNEPILEREYPLVDFVQESPAVYALCYKCHDRQILEDNANFEHKKHLQNADAPCAACHDPHGSRNATHLINFLRFDAIGNSVVVPSPSTGRLEFNDLGAGRGECYLMCHAEDHCPRSYDGPDKDEIGDCP
jgi:predicted CXXCH cytochrome family protein